VLKISENRIQPQFGEEAKTKPGYGLIYFLKKSKINATMAKKKKSIYSLNYLNAV